MELNAETVQCFLYALADEAKQRGCMFPQTVDDQNSDNDAIHKVCALIRWYAEHGGYPRTEEIAKLHALRAKSMTLNKW